MDQYAHQVPCIGYLLICTLIRALFLLRSSMRASIGRFLCLLISALIRTLITVRGSMRETIRSSSAVQRVPLELQVGPHPVPTAQINARIIWLVPMHIYQRADLHADNSARINAWINQGIDIPPRGGGVGTNRVRINVQIKKYPLDCIDPRTARHTVTNVQISALINRRRNQTIDARIDLRSGNRVRINVQIKRDLLDGT